MCRLCARGGDPEGDSDGAEAHRPGNVTRDGRYHRHLSRLLPPPASSRRQQTARSTGAVESRNSAGRRMVEDLHRRASPLADRIHSHPVQHVGTVGPRTTDRTGSRQRALYRLVCRCSRGRWCMLLPSWWTTTGSCRSFRGDLWSVRRLAQLGIAPTKHDAGQGDSVSDGIPPRNQRSDSLPPSWNRLGGASRRSHRRLSHQRGLVANSWPTDHPVPNPRRCPHRHPGGCVSSLNRGHFGRPGIAGMRGSCC